MQHFTFSGSVTTRNMYMFTQLTLQFVWKAKAAAIGLPKIFALVTRKDKSVRFETFQQEM